MILISKNTSSAIKPENANLFAELCTEQILTSIRPNDVKQKKKQRKQASETYDLKMKLQSSSKNIVLSNREIRLLRHLPLTEEEKDKVKGSSKVAKKLEKLENLGQERNYSDSEDEEVENIEQDYASLDSVPSDNSLSGLPSLNHFSPKNSEPPSMLESMKMMEDLYNSKIDQAERMNQLLELMTVAAVMPSDQIGSESSIDDGLLMKEARPW